MSCVSSSYSDAVQSQRQRKNVGLLSIGRNKEDSHGFLFLILFLTLSQDFVIKKLSSILSAIRTNFGHGIAKVSTSAGTQGRAETSNIHNTEHGRSDWSSW